MTESKLGFSLPYAMKILILYFEGDITVFFNEMC